MQSDISIEDDVINLNDKVGNSVNNLSEKVGNDAINLQGFAGIQTVSKSLPFLLLNTSFMHKVVIIYARIYNNALYYHECISFHSFIFHIYIYTYIYII